MEEYRETASATAPEADEAEELIAFAFTALNDSAESKDEGEED
jgi:hypothetical protein